MIAISDVMNPNTSLEDPRGILQEQLRIAPLLHYLATLTLRDNHLHSSKQEHRRGYECTEHQESWEASDHRYRFLRFDSHVLVAALNLRMLRQIHQTSDHLVQCSDIRVSHLHA